MKKTTLYLLIALLIFWIILGCWLCCNFWGGAAIADSDEKEQITEIVTEPVVESGYLLSLADGDRFSANANENIDFVQSAYNYLPLGVGLTGLLDQTADYLKSTTDRSITVTGRYGSAEENNSILPTLGLARANQVKQLLIDRGVDSKRILTSDLLTDGNIAVGDTLFGGVGFGFGEYVVSEETRIPRIKSELVGKPITIYFPSGKNQVQLSAEQRQLFSDIIYYLDNVGASKLSVTGYTDDTGNIEGNTRLSRKRAEFVRDYLAENGISIRKILAIGKGPENPVATNETPDGRALNRRVEVILR